jgi:hypothetical protein
MIRGQLHQTLQRPPLQHIGLIKDNLFDHDAKSYEAGIPIIYGLVHCGSDGVTPTAFEYLQGIDIHKKYIDTIHSGEHDELAREIDEGEPSDADRKWIAGARGDSRLSWYVS